MREGWQDAGGKGALKALPAGLGVGVESYEPKQKRNYDSSPISQAAPVPEPPETIRQQFDSAIDAESPRVAVLATPGERVPARLTGFAQIDVDGHGTLYVNRAKARAMGRTRPADLHTFISQHGFEPLIGKVAPVADTSQGVALRTEDAQGRELSTSIVPDGATAQTQAALDRAQFPQAANHTLLTARTAVARRRAQMQRSA